MKSDLQMKVSSSSTHRKSKLHIGMREVKEMRGHPGIKSSLCIICVNLLKVLIKSTVQIHGVLALFHVSH